MCLKIKMIIEIYNIILWKKIKIELKKKKNKKKKIKVHQERSQTPLRRLSLKKIRNLKTAMKQWFQYHCPLSAT